MTAAHESLGRAPAGRQIIASPLGWRALDTLLLVAASVLAAVELWHAPRWTADDAWIVARYADHLAHDGVFAFNLEGPHVEGITSPVFAVLGAAGSLLGLGAVPTMTTIGGASFVLSGALICGLARELRAPAPAGGIVAFLYLTVPEHVVHASSGLETEAYLSMELACAWAFARALRRPNRGTRALVTACLSATLLRPEGVALSLVLVGAAALRGRSRPEVERKRFARIVVAGWGVPVFFLLVARLAYFHAVLPNTYFAKRGEANLVHVSDLVFLGDRYFLDAGIAGVGLFFLSSLLGAARRRISPRWVMMAAVAVAILVANVVGYARADLVMNYQYRFAMHALPWLAVLALGVLAAGITQLQRLAREAPLPAALLGSVATIALVAGVSARSSSRESDDLWMTRYEKMVKNDYLPIAGYLQEHAAKRAQLAVYPDAGIVPYRTKLFTLDFGRLNDIYLAREARSPADIARYFFASAPDAFVVTQVGPGRLWDDGADAIVHAPEFDGLYALALDYSNDDEHRGPRLYVRRR
jgi:hypothetical protein